MHKYNKELTEEVKTIARKMGAEMVGVAPVERFKNAPLMLSPKGLLPTAKSVVVAGVVWLDASMELAEKEVSEHQFNLYGIGQDETGMNQRLNSIAFNIAKFLESCSYKSIPTSSSNMWRYHPYKDIKHPFAPDLVNRYAGVRGDKSLALQALMLDPMAILPEKAERMLDELLANSENLLPQFK